MDRFLSPCVVALSRPTRGQGSQNRPPPPCSEIGFQTWCWVAFNPGILQRDTVCNTSAGGKRQVPDLSSSDPCRIVEAMSALCFHFLRFAAFKCYLNCIDSEHSVLCILQLILFNFVGRKCKPEESGRIKRNAKQMPKRTDPFFVATNSLTTLAFHIE